MKVNRPLLNTDLLRPFDKKQAEEAIPLFILGTADLKNTDKPDGIPDTLHALGKANGFTGNIGDVIASETGVLIGAGDGSDPFFIAAGAQRLPEGTYTLARPLQDQGNKLAALGWLLGAYRFDRYRTMPPAKASLICPEGVDIEAVQREAQATAYVRDLVNIPTNDMLPDDLEQAARDLSERYSASLSVITGDDLLTENFPMIHAVGRASTVAPRLLDLRWSPDDQTNAPKITLVGKGVCFDSGGLNIKGAGGMGLMKKDMGGSAHALGLAHLIMDAKLPVALRVLIPAVENAIAGNAFRPGDILNARNGLTVEIGNTDAEGRLILGDALTFAGEEDPDLIISLATLTGAARVALGPEVIPFYCEDESLANAMTEASQTEFDPAWHMPLWQRYHANLASPVADMNNISGNSFAGSIIAALFLQRFVPTTTLWMHFDLYAWRPSPEPGRPKGGEAQCIRALYSVLAERYGRSAIVKSQ